MGRISVDRGAEAQRIRVAMESLLDATSGEYHAWELTVVNLARKADVKRVALTHRHPELREEFQRRAAPLRSQLGQVAAAVTTDENKARLLILKDENLALQREITALERLVHALAVDNTSLRDQLSLPRLAAVNELAARFRAT